jgi:plastocyanin
LTFAYSSGTLGSSSRMYSDAIKFVSTASPSQSPVILMQPEDRAVTQNQSPIFSVNASGSGTLSYQWRLNGANISGATGTSFTRTNAQSSHAGNYSVIVSSAFGSATSSNAVLTVNSPVTVVTQPQQQTANPGDNITFNVSANGTAPLGYRWRYNGMDIPGATNSNHTVNDVQAEDAGNYSVVIYNLLGGVGSSNAVLTVRTPPEILSHPQEQTVNPGATVVFTVTASGTAPLSYQWQFNGTNISGSGSSYTLNNVQPENAGTYTVNVINPAGIATSDPASLIVRRPPVINTHPLSQSVSAGTNVTFSIVATGSEPMTYQWRKNGTNLTEAAQEELTLNNVQPSDAGSYSVVISNDLGSAMSSNAELTVELPTEIRIDSITILPDGRARLFITGEAGNYGIEATTNLATWLELTNFATSTNWFEFIDSETNLPLRYYRARTTTDE